MIRFVLALVVTAMVVQADDIKRPSAGSDLGNGAKPPTSQDSGFDLNRLSPAESAPSLQRKHEEDGMSDEFLLAAGILIVASAATIGVLMFALGPRRSRRHSRRRRATS